MSGQTKARRSIALFAIILAGEVIFFLPFVLARIFRPTMLDVFEITNRELGTFFSVYGIVAMVSYLFGGTLADRFPARNLMTLALLLTSLGGISLVGIPSAKCMMILYAFWGFTTIYLFWAAMISATREWGGTSFQGRAFGWLEGGRGVVAALLGTFSFLMFSWSSGEIPTAELEAGEWHALQTVILVTSLFTFITGFVVLLFVPSNKRDYSGSPSKIALQKIKILGRRPQIWLLAIIIISAYSGYKITDDYSLFAKEVLGFTEVGAAGIGTAALWMRALVAILAGYLADRINRVHVIIGSFALTIAGGLLVGFGILSNITCMALMNLALTAIGIYGVRALYFAVQNEARIPLAFTGTAVGIVSLMGFTPEVFMSPWMGNLLDSHPGETGHQYVFLVLSLFAFIGMLAALVFRWFTTAPRFLEFPDE